MFSIIRVLHKSSFSEDHSIDGQVVISFVQCIRIMISYVEFASLGKKVVSCHDCKLFKGLIFKEPTITIELSVSFTDNKCTCSIKIQNPNKFSRITFIPAYKGHFILDNHYSGTKYDKNLIYPSNINTNVYNSPELFHGKSYQLLRGYGNETDSSLIGIAKGNSDSLIHELEDSIYQIFLKWAWIKNKDIVLPHSVKEYQIFYPLNPKHKYFVKMEYLGHVGRLREYQFITYNDKNEIFSKGITSLVIRE